MSLDVINVAHVADGNGKCSRCGAGLGNYVRVADSEGTIITKGKRKGQFKPLPAVERPWAKGERVIEYEMPNARTGFADQVFGWTQDCVP
jgi:hypothetical protein